MTPEEVAAHLVARATWRYSRASGPGGQHRDHAETRAEMTLRRSALSKPPAPLAARLAAALRLDRRPLRLASQATRSRDRNRERVERRLEERVALAVAPRRRRVPTSPSAAARAGRVEAKRRRSALKEGRRPPEAE